MQQDENLCFFHPNDTQKIVKTMMKDRKKRPLIENFALRFTHFLKITEEEKKHRKTGKYKVEFPKDCTSLSEKGQEILTALHTRREASLAALRQQHELCKLNGNIDWRMVIGLGGAHVLETSMTLHHVYGIPYIPGSAVKGIARHVAIEELCEELEHEEQPDILDALCNLSFAELEKLDTRQKKWDYVRETGKISRDKKPVFPEKATITKILEEWSDFRTVQQVFGGQEQSGTVIFLDAFPVGNVKLTTDIMNPHYPDYYNSQGKTPPTDCQEPKPVNFLTIEKASFDFYLLLKTRRGEDVNTTCLKKAEEWLQAALEMNGIGAKSAVGYGYFEHVTNHTDAFLEVVDKERREAEQAAGRLRWESLSEVDRLCEELSVLRNVNRSYDIYSQDLERFEGDEQKRLANAIKMYWESIHRWKVKKEKQKDKVERIKQILRA